MTMPRRITLILMITALLSGAAYGAGWGWQATTTSNDTPAPGQRGERSEQRRAAESAETCERARRASQVCADSSEPSAVPPTEHSPEPEPTLKPGPRLLGPGDSGAEVRELQARLRQIDWFDADVTDHYGPVTTEAVRGFQARREIPVTGWVDQRTLDRLHAMTAEPAEAELANEPPPSAGNTPGALDPRCTTGRVLCVDKTSATLRWVVDGQVLKAFDARVGGPGFETREGRFGVYRMSPDHVSSIYETSMPFAMFFSGGQAVHYSPDFAAVGYNGASHGCVNIRDYDGIAWLFDQVRVGDSVVVYRS